MYTLHFEYNTTSKIPRELGRGGLVLMCDDKVVGTWLARTGSINIKGELVNALPIEIYILKTTHEDTTEPAMVIDGQAWKTRLYKADGSFTHLLIHPDGGKGGTLGCIGIQSLSLELRDTLDKIIKEQKTVYLYTGTK